MIIHSISVIGLRSSNEDHHNIILGRNQILNSIFDGHGGKTVSKYLYENLYKYYINLKPSFIDDKNNFIKYTNAVYNKIQTDLTIDKLKNVRHTGSTALVSIIYDNNSKMYVMNCGDCRIIAGNKQNVAFQLSNDHKPGKPYERARLKKLGGKITHDGYDWRIKDLSVSRSFGDLDTKPYISHIPDVFRYNIKDFKIIVLACDGLWDVLSNQEVINFITTNITKLSEKNVLLSQIDKHNSQNIAKLLAEYAIKKGSTDNVSIIIIIL